MQVPCLVGSLGGGYLLSRAVLVDMPPRSGDAENGRGELRLCEGIAEEPSLAFEPLPDAYPLKYTVAQSRWDFHEPGYYFGPERYHVRVVTNEEDLDSVFWFEEMDAESRSRVEGVDFDEYVLVAVESGYGSGSRTHRWIRVEPVENGIHLYGCYAGSQETDDLSAYCSVLKVARPDDTSVEVAHVSLTVEEDRTVTFDSTDGLVTIGE